MRPGVYKATVYDDVDPEGRSRVQMLVPQVTGLEPTGWAWPLLPAAALDVAVPARGQAVWAVYEAGDEEHPAWLGTWQAAGAIEWTDAALLHSWASSAPNVARFVRLANKVVALEGLLTAGTVGLAAFVLDEALQPERNLIFPAVTGAGAFTTVEVHSDGSVLSPTATAYRIDGIHFVAGA